MSKGFAGIYILLGILLLVAFGGGYYFGAGKNIISVLFRNNPKICTQDAKQCLDGSYVGRIGPNCEFKSCPASKPTPSPSEVVYTESSHSASWETYSFEKYVSRYGRAYSLSFSYPPNWKVRDHDYLSGADVAFLSPDYKTPEMGIAEEILKGYRIEVSVLSNQKFSSLEEWVKNYYYNPRERKVYVNPQKTKIGTIDALMFEWKDKETGKIDMITAHTFHAKVFAKGDAVYIFQVVAPSISSEYISTMDKMLATVKFLDQDRTGTENIFCGGFAGTVCPLGYKCQLDGNYPDAGGRCIKE